jgi:CubicO group peptidase (beta-lactamase class C family)
MAENHIGGLEISPLPSAMPPLSHELSLFPGMAKGWGLSFLINSEPVRGGRAAGSLAWAGLANTYFWIDRDRRVCGVFASQLLPFLDHTATDLYAKFETAVYGAL